MSKTDNQEKNIKRKNLGDFGEEIAAELLREKGYKNVTNLNDLCPNAPYADIYAEKGGEKLIISVKTRNRIGDNGQENNSYNLSYGNNDKRGKLAEEKFKFIPYWIAIEVEGNNSKGKCVYSIYFDSLAALGGKNAIPMKKYRQEKIGKIGACWVKEKTLPKEWVKKIK